MIQESLEGDRYTFDASKPNPPICIIRCVSSIAAQETDNLQWVMFERDSVD